MIERGTAALACVVFVTVACGSPEDMRYRVRAEATGPTTAGPASEFVALIPATEDQPRCFQSRNPPALLDGALTLDFGEPLARRVTVRLDPSGNLTSYSDMRGDLVSSDERTGDQTVVAINFVQGHALGTNRPAAGPPSSLRVPVDEALDSEKFGNPRAMIDEVVSRCQ